MHKAFRGWATFLVLLAALFIIYLAMPVLDVMKGRAAHKAELWPSTHSPLTAVDLAAARVASELCPNVQIDPQLWDAALLALGVDPAGTRGEPVIGQIADYVRSRWDQNRYAELCAIAVQAYARDGRIPLLTRRLKKE